MSWLFAREKFWMSLSRTQMAWMGGGYARYVAAKESVLEIDSSSLTLRAAATRRRLSPHHAHHP